MHVEASLQKIKNSLDGIVKKVFIFIKENLDNITMKEEFFAVFHLY